jgi:hypothetical protein
MDLTQDPVKFNPSSSDNTDGPSGGAFPTPLRGYSTVDDPGYNQPADPNSGDWTGWVVAGGMWGIWRYQRVSDVLEAEGSPLARAGNPGIVNQVTAEGRFTSADGTGIFALGHGVKYASGSNAGSPPIVFPVSAAVLAAFPSTLMKVEAVFCVNGTAIPNTVSLDVGFYPVTISGGAGNLVYTLSTTGQIVENYSAGIANNTMYGRDNPDRHAAFVANGDKNYAMGVNIGNALPANTVVDISLALGVTPY